VVLMPKVGDTLWTINPRDRREGWKSYVITGETRQSWLVGEMRFTPAKVNKHTMLENHGQWGMQRWFTEQGMIDQRFMDEQRHHIARLVGVESDVAKLKKIAEIIGMEVTCSPQN